jgi:hypothetical protein
MKKIFMILILLLIVTSSLAFAIEVNVSVKLNDSYIVSDEKNILIDDTAYIVARSLVNALNEKIVWDNETRTVTITNELNEIKFIVDSNTVLVNSKKIEIDSKPFIRNGRTYIPLRIVADYLGCNINWVQETYTVELYKKDVIVKDDYIYTPNYNDFDLETLSKIVQVESSDGSMEMKLAIANVVLNRVKSNRFPNTVADVIYQKDVHVQFPPAHRDSFKTVEPSLYTKIAAKNALEGLNNIDECLFFNNSPFKSKSDDLYKIIEGEYFYK